MPSADLLIGGLRLRLEGGAGVAAALTLPGMNVFADDSGAVPHITLSLDERLQRPPCRLLHSFDILDGREVCRFGVDAEGVYHYTFGQREVVRFDPKCPDAALLSPLPDPSSMRFALWLAYSMTALRYGRMPVHSSVVACDGRAVMCLGESGTGKSTHTRLWLQHIPSTHLLNDDSPILAVEDDGGVAVYGSPWSGKTDCYRQERLPLAALLRLEQRPSNTIRRLSTLEAFGALQPSCPPAMAHDEPCLDRMVALISQIIQQVPVYRLGCLPDADAALLSHSTIYGS